MIDMPPPGFRGLDPTKPLRMFVRRLPHWRQEGATYFVTFRLHDSLPVAKLAELRAQRREWLEHHPDPSQGDWDDHAREQMAAIERVLDRGRGECLLGDRSRAAIVSDALRHFDGRRYDLSSLVCMPNHVHVTVSPLPEQSLETILQSWKCFTARAINKQLGRSGSVWQEGYFDRIVRDTPHLRRIVKYVLNNGCRAGVAAPVWLRPSWRDWSGQADGEAGSDGRTNMSTLRGSDCVDV